MFRRTGLEHGLRQAACFRPENEHVAGHVVQRVVTHCAAGRDREPARRGDRVVVRTKDGEVMVKELKRRTTKTLELQSLNPAQADRTL
mgnify:CR=1 FL=1